MHTEACNHGPQPVMQQLDPSVFKRWYSIYPCYLNSMLSLQKGRRLPREKCVPNPQLPEVSHCLSFLRLRHVVEPVSSLVLTLAAQVASPCLGQPRPSEARALR